MFRSYALEPLNGAGAQLVFEWDPDTGQLRGRDAAHVREQAELAKKAGYMLGHPHPTPYKIGAPLRRASELAVILGNLYRLPPDLADAYPQPPEGNDLPEGAIA